MHNLRILQGQFLRTLLLFGILRLHLDRFLRLWGISTYSKTFFINSGAISDLTLNISVISLCRLRRCTLVQLTILSSSSKDESKSPFADLKSGKSGIYFLVVKQPHKLTIRKVANCVRIQYKSPLLKFVDDASQDKALIFWLDFLHKESIFSIKFRLLSILIPKCFSHLLVEIVSISFVLLQKSLPDNRRWYLPGLAFLMLSLNQLKRNSPIISNLCVTYKGFTSVL